ncbi:MAG TPA: retropepsin-like aspartic protease [Acidobacteriota bacterium]|nr:retropepsin-like aspartic protease [Acidobacteriota bacterium]
MKITAILKYGLFACLIAWAAQAIYLWVDNKNTPSRVKSEEASERHRITVAHKEAMISLESEYMAKMYQATGATVFDRIYNTQEQTITDLISRLAVEAFPQDWATSVMVEEFVKFILLVYLPHGRREPSLDSIILSLRPVIEHSAWALSNVAIFDHRHKSFLFFDEAMISRIRENVSLSPEMVKLAKIRGEAFTRFNSVTVDGEIHNSHLILPMEATGPHGTVVARAMLDTGATTTMLSEKIIQETGTDDLTKAPRRTFRTVNGTISCPIVTREINIGGVIKTIDVAVNQQDDQNLIGMNFFEGMDYIIDSAQAAVHIWNK